MQFPFWGALCFPSQSCCSLQGPQFHMHCTVPIALREQVNHTTIPYAQCPLLKRNNQDSQRTRKTHHYPMCTAHIAQEEQFRFRENKNDDSQLQNYMQGRENRVDLVLRCCKRDHKSLAPRMQMVYLGASKPVTLQGIGFLLARARLIVESSVRSPDLENSPAKT